MSSVLKKDYFQLFGLPARFAIERDLLDTRFRTLQREIHPDRFAHAGDQERRISVQQAAQLNEGYQTLKDPLLRGRYLLELRGHQFNDELSTTRDTEFLMEQMELREQLESIREKQDPLAEIGTLLQHCKTRQGELADHLGQVLDDTDATIVPKDAIDLVLKLQFYRKLEHEAENLEMDLEDEYS